MIKKHKIWVTLGIIAFLFLCAFPVNAKEVKENDVWDITLKGYGEEPFFQSSVEVEVDLKGMTTEEDVTIFINRQKWEGEWDYGKSTKIILREEGNYTIHFIHKNGYEETKEITVELSNPQPAKIDTKSYTAGTWTNHKIVLKAYGSKAVSGISDYEYKIRSGEWKIMKDHQLEIKDDFDEEIMIRPVSRAGRYGDITKIWCRLWKKKPEIPRILCDQRSSDGWYQTFPKFFLDAEAAKGAPIHIYAKLTNIETGQTQTDKDKVPVIKEDGKYDLKMWAEDEAGNKSEVSHTVYFVDTTKPEIFVKYKMPKNIHGILKYQKAEIKIRDKNLLNMTASLKTSGRQTRPWKKSGQYYETEVVFEKDGIQNLLIQAKDMAGNITVKKEEPFKIDTVKPKISIEGIMDGKSYQRPITFDVKVKDENLNQEKTRIRLNERKWSGGTIRKDGYYTLTVETEDLAGNKNMLKKRFTMNQRGIDIRFLQKNLNGKYSSDKNLKPGFQIISLEPVEVKSFLVNEEKVPYEWKKDKVFLKNPVTENGKCTVSLRVKDANGCEGSSGEITFYYDTKNPVIKVKGIDQNGECSYGDEIIISLENEKDHWKKVRLDGKNINAVKSEIHFKKLEPGAHILDVEAEDLALNKTKRSIKFTVTKILPDPIRKITRQNKKIKQKSTADSQKTGTSAGIITSLILMVSAAVFIYKKRSKL